MKDKIMLFIIGVLVGAVIATGAFFVYTKASNNKCTNQQSQQMQGGTPPEMPNNQNGQNNSNGQPPEMPSDNSTNSNGTTNNS